jgi:hypothetical protein
MIRQDKKPTLAISGLSSPNQKKRATVLSIYSNNMYKTQQQND